jgi:hypothetical protein
MRKRSAPMACVPLCRACAWRSTCDFAAHEHTGLARHACCGMLWLQG